MIDYKALFHYSSEILLKLSSHTPFYNFNPAKQNNRKEGASSFIWETITNLKGYVSEEYLTSLFKIRLWRYLTTYHI